MKSSTLDTYCLIMKFSSILLILCSSITLHAQEIDLFKNGMADWNTYLGPPHYSVDMGHGPVLKGVKREPVGLNNDPKGVFRFIEFEGKQTLKITGEVFGAVTSKKEYENFHFSVRFKWGKRKWSPRASMLRDSGFLFHCYGNQGEISGFWMPSIECQIQENDCGDLWLLDTAGKVPIVTREGKPHRVTKLPKLIKTYKDGEPFRYCNEENGRHVEHGPSEENLTGWNTVEVYTMGQRSVFIVNGKPNMVVTDLEDREGNPLSRGKLQLQSEGAEVYYQDAKIRSIKAFPEKLEKLFETE